VGAAVGERLTEPLSPHQAGEPVPSRPHTELRRVTFKAWDERSTVWAVRGVGFMWDCTCGERSRTITDRREALAAKHEHEAEHH
jgi:hypothetical protein